MSRIIIAMIALSLAPMIATGAHAATPPSAALLADINPGTGSSFSSYPFTPGVNVNGIYFFYATDGVHGFELWKSDGTTAGTVMVKDINPGSGNSNISGLTAFGSYVIFSANDGTNGQKAWISDGTAAGTIPLLSGTTYIDSSAFCICSPPSLGGNAYAYFLAGPSPYQLWRTDGTVAGTVQITNFAGSYYFQNLFASAGQLFLSTGNAFYQNDGVSSTLTTLLSSTTAMFSAVASGNYLYVANGTSLYCTDGTAAGTTLLVSTGAQQLVASGTNVYFCTSAGVWVTNGTPQSTTRVSTTTGGSSPFGLATYNGLLYYFAWNGTAYQLWKTDGTSAGTVAVTSNLPTIGSTFPLYVIGGYLFYHNTADNSLWMSDGTTAGTVVVPNSVGVTNAVFPSTGSRVFFQGTDSTHGLELWSLSYAGPSVSTPAAATPNPTAGTTTALSVLGADSLGESTLIYTWSLTGTPPAGVTFSNNGTNLAKNTEVSFTKAGVYNFSCLITDAYNLTVTSAVTVTVSQTLTSIALSATPTSLHQHQQFTRTGLDQFNQSMATQPTVTWSLSGGKLGTISSSGYYASNGDFGGPYTVTATSGSISGTAQVTTTSTSLIVVTGAIFGFTGQVASETIAISGATGVSQTITLTGATFNGGGTSQNQAAQTTAQYSLTPNSGSTSVSAAVGSQPITPSITLSSCVISNIFRAGANQQPPYSLAIGPGNDAPVTVTFAPALPAQVSVVFDVETASGTNPGSATIVSGATQTGTGGTLTVKGLAKSAIGSSLRIVGRSPGSPAEFCSGAPFTVCPHPETVTLSNNNAYPSRNPPTSPMHGQGHIGLTGVYWGIIPTLIFASDTSPAPGLNELFDANAIESVQIGHIDTNAWSVPGIAAQTDEEVANGLWEDVVAVGYDNINQGQSGTYTVNQLFIFHCKVCGMNHVAVPYSGFIHTHTTVAPENAANTLTTSDAPSSGSVSVNGLSTSPGYGSVPSDTATPTSGYSPPQLIEVTDTAGP